MKPRTLKCAKCPGQVKSNIGHGEAVAGLNGLLKAILTVENGLIPGNPTFLEPSPLSKTRVPSSKGRHRTHEADTLGS